MNRIVLQQNLIQQKKKRSVYNNKKQIKDKKKQRQNYFLLYPQLIHQQNQYQLMYSTIKAYYDNDDISQRKEEYYEQVLSNNHKRVSPYKTIHIDKVPQPKISLSSQDNHSINNTQFMPQSSMVSQKQQPIKTSNNQHHLPIKYNYDLPIKYNNQQNRQSFSKVNTNLLQSDPQRYKALQQRAQLFKKLQLVTIGLPIQQNTCQNELISKQYILPHYKSSKISQIKEQQQKIKLLTAQMLQNQKVIGKMKKVQQSLIDRVSRIRQIDQQIYSKLDQDRTQQVEGYLRIAKNMLAEGQSEEKIIAVLRKILY